SVCGVCACVWGWSLCVCVCVCACFLCLSVCGVCACVWGWFVCVCVCVCVHGVCGSVALWLCAGLFARGVSTVPVLAPGSRDAGQTRARRGPDAGRRIERASLTA